MNPFGKLTTAIVSGMNENTVALVNVNFDLSLFRCEPLAEFLPVGLALTPSRKREGEFGDIHHTACILGFLFQDIIPDTPELRKAFGNRVSEILSRPDVNPRGTKEHGPFKDFIGAEGTGIGLRRPRVTRPLAFCSLHVFWRMSLTPNRPYQSGSSSSTSGNNTSSPRFAMAKL
jgi:hypothetical protein